MSDVISTIEKAFSGRIRPNEFVGSSNLSNDELGEIFAISKITWGETTSDFWERNFDVISWLSPEAYCYYLPGVMKCSIEDHALGLIVVQSVISVLDRTPNPDWWDSFFWRGGHYLRSKSVSPFKNGFFGYPLKKIQTSMIIALNVRYKRFNFLSKRKMVEATPWSCLCNSGHADTVKLMTLPAFSSL